jgi:uncharacterized membrane protein
VDDLVALVSREPGLMLRYSPSPDSFGTTSTGDVVPALDLPLSLPTPWEGPLERWITHQLASVRAAAADAHGASIPPGECHAWVVRGAGPTLEVLAVVDDAVLDVAQRMAAASSGAGRLGSGSRRAMATIRSGVERLEQGPLADPVVKLLAAPAAKAGAGTWGEVLKGSWLGHPLHPAATDLPIGCWISAAILDVLGGRLARPAAQRLVALGILSVPVTVASGLADWSTLREQERRRVGAIHAFGNVLVTVLYVRSWSARRAGRHRRGVGWGFAGGILATSTAYLGGHVAFARPPTA